MGNAAAKRKAYMEASIAEREYYDRASKAERERIEREVEARLNHEYRMKRIDAFERAIHNSTATCPRTRVTYTGLGAIFKAAGAANTIQMLNAMDRGYKLESSGNLAINF